MKRKMMKIAMLYIADLVEDVFPDDEEMTVEKFINLMSITFEYHEVVTGSRIDAILTILEHGELEASFNFNIAR